jgi:hypothetical protein
MQGRIKKKLENVCSVTILEHLPGLTFENGGSDVSVRDSPHS